MAVATFQGTVQDGQVRLAPDVQLPEHATVYVVVPDAEQPVNGQALRADGQRMAAALQRLAALGTFTGIADPVAWQRAQRADRELPNRAD